MGHTIIFFYIVVFATANSKYDRCKIFPMTRTSGIQSNCSDNLAMTTTLG